MRARLEDVCERGSSNLRQADVAGRSGDYPIYGASGYIGNVDFYHQELPYVAIVKDGAGIGRTALLPAKSSVIGTMQYLLPKKNVLPEYLCYVVRYMHLEKYFSGATIPHIYFRDYKSEEFNLVPVDYQEEIVATLGKIEAIVAARQRQLQKLDELVKARFIELFGGIHNSNKYPYKPIQELTDVISGGTPNRDVNEYWECGTIPWVKTTELQNNLIKEVDEYITEKGLNSSSAKLVPPGTVLIAMYGQGKTRGMTAYLNIEACTNQACACILPSDQINQTFLWKFLILSYDNLRGMAKGGNQPNLNGTIIKNYPILYPPIELQEQFAAFVEQTDKSKAVIQKALDEAQLLFDSLMQKYFG
jgi:type I restriction enzyme S subunit